MQIWIVLAILAGCMFLFIKDIIAAEIVAILAVLSLILTRVLTTEEAFKGFGDPSLMTIVCVFILSAALVRTGVVDFVGRKIENLAGKNYIFLLALSMIVVVTISAFINNAAAFDIGCVSNTVSAKKAASSAVGPRVPTQSTINEPT